MITEKQQRLLMEMFENDGKITKKGQTVYDSHAFYEKMSRLKELQLIASKRIINGNKGIDPLMYYLTHRGIAFVKILRGENWL